MDKNIDLRKYDTSNIKNLIDYLTINLNDEKDDSMRNYINCPKCTNRTY